jgi:hypothetical protein
MQARAMMVPETLDEGRAILATRTGMTPAQWDDFWACTRAQQELIVATEEHMQWTQDRDILADAVAVMTVMVTIAGAVSGVGTALEVMRAL